jgi:hypothetical protein
MKRIMRIWFGPVLFLCSINCFPQNTPTIESLFTQLNQPDFSATSCAAMQIYHLAWHDAAARDYLAQKLPAMISANAKGDWQSVTLAWNNAVRLAGQLRVEAAIPALMQSLSGRDPVPVWAWDKPWQGGSTLGRDAILENDIVARALADIGDPAIPAVADLLANGETRVMRVRAAWILKNINTPAARTVMSDRLQIETNSDIRKLLGALLK